MEREEIIQPRFANTIRSEGVGTGMLVLDNMTWYVELRVNSKLLLIQHCTSNQSFAQIKEEFLSVIDHLETSDEEPEMRKKERTQ